MGALPKPMDVAEFLVWEDRQELRYEFDGIAAKAMTGGTLAHGGIQAKLLKLLGIHLDGKPCQPFGSDTRVRTHAGIRYPDALVKCSPSNPTATFVDDPVVIFEILSTGTANMDLGVKKAEYQSMPSVRRYVVLQQTHRAAEVFFRMKDADDGWGHEFLSAEDGLAMPEIGISIPLADIYMGLALAGRRGVNFPA